MFVDLVFDLIGCICHVDGRVGIRSGHLRLGPLKRREEFGVNERGLGVLELLCHIPGKSEIRILINGARNQGWNILFITKYMREGVGERRSRLDGAEVKFADVVAVFD